MTEKECAACEDESWPKADNEDGEPLERIWLADGSGPWYIQKSHHALIARLRAEVEELRKHPTIQGFLQMKGERDAALAKLEEARKWAFCYLNHISQTEKLATWTSWSFVWEMAHDIDAVWWENTEWRLRKDVMAAGTGSWVSPAEARRALGGGK